MAVESSAIVGLSVGRVTGPRSLSDDTTVTLIWAGAAQPFMVAAPFELVLAHWRASRSDGLSGSHAASGWKFLPIQEGSRT